MLPSTSGFWWWWKTVYNQGFSFWLCMRGNGWFSELWICTELLCLRETGSEAQHNPREKWASCGFPQITSQEVNSRGLCLLAWQSSRGQTALDAFLQAWKINSQKGKNYPSLEYSDGCLCSNSFFWMFLPGVVNTGALKLFTDLQHLWHSSLSHLLNACNIRPGGTLLDPEWLCVT